MCIAFSQKSAGKEPSDTSGATPDQLIDQAWVFVRKNQPDQAAALLERARAAGADDPRIEAAIAATPEMRRRTRVEEDERRKKQADELLSNEIKLDAEHNLVRVEDANLELLRSIAERDVVGLAQFVDPDVDLRLKSLAGAYQREREEANIRKDARFVDLLGRLVVRLEKATFVVRSTNDAVWTGRNFEIEFPEPLGPGLSHRVWISS